MATFFEHQDRARKNTRSLILLMVLAVIGMGSSLYGLCLMAEAWLASRSRFSTGAPLIANANLFWYCVIGTALLVVVASSFRSLSLRGGGAHIAEMLGGRLISGQPRDVLERRLVNVVEEMALASGVPVPQVFVLDNEAGINAFAAGHTLDDAAVAVTRGCLEKLTREELQGVVAHEFSHVLNGDMRLNIRLMGVVFGIVCIALCGRLLMRAASNTSYASSRRNRDNNGMAFFLFGLGLFLIGTVGELFGKWIKAAVSRQREYLADASAVQFTRNPQGISHALQKIGGFSKGASVNASSAEEASHFFFGDIHAKHFLGGGLFATHPPLRERIARIDPSFDGQMPVVPEGIAEPEESTPAASGFAAANTLVSTMVRPGSQDLPHAGRLSADELAGARARARARATDGAGARPRALGVETAGYGSEGARASGTPSDRARALSATAASVVAQVGAPNMAAIEEGRRLLAVMPPKLRDAARNPFSASAIVYALLLSEEAGVRDVQRQAIDSISGAPLHQETLRLAAEVQQLSRRDRLPLVELLAPALRELSRDQRAVFKRTVQSLIEADHAVSIFEYVLAETLRARLSEEGAAARARVRHQSLWSVTAELQLLLSLLAHAGDFDGDGAKRAFVAGAARLGKLDISLLPPGPKLLPALGAALTELAALAPIHGSRVIDACIHAVFEDRRVTDDEATLLRAVCDALGAPLPPLPE